MKKKYRLVFDNSICLDARTVDRLKAYYISHSDESTGLKMDQNIRNKAQISIVLVKLCRIFNLVDSFNLSVYLSRLKVNFQLLTPLI